VVKRKRRMAQERKKEKEKGKREKGNGDLLHKSEVDYTTTGDGNSALCTVSCAELHGVRQAYLR